MCGGGLFSSRTDWNMFLPFRSPGFKVCGGEEEAAADVPQDSDEQADPDSPRVLCSAHQGDTASAVAFLPVSSLSLSPSLSLTHTHV